MGNPMTRARTQAASVIDGELPYIEASPMAQSMLQLHIYTVAYNISTLPSRTERQAALLDIYPSYRNAVENTARQLFTASRTTG